jgi:glycosyltransferase involved in cell wall biosynthesis
MRTILFLRSFKKFTGGHLKTWNYFNHVFASPHFTPRILLSEKTKWDRDNPWLGAHEYIVAPEAPIWPDAIFLAGRDWIMLDRYPYLSSDTPIINLVQHVRHADEQNSRFEFLQRKAIRICVSEEVAEALRNTGLAAGPIIAIPNAMDVEVESVPNNPDRPIDALIVAVKEPGFGEIVAHRLTNEGRCIELLNERLPRADFLHRMRLARVTVFLPHETEGFYLPALEGMALGTLVVCPDCVGNRSFCLPRQNAFRPEYAVDAIVDDAEAAMALAPEQAHEMLEKARAMAESHSLPRERLAFLDVLHNIDALWRGISDDIQPARATFEGRGRKRRARLQGAGLAGGEDADDSNATFLQ